MKKLVSLLLVLMLALALTACQQTAVTPTAAPAEEPAAPADTAVTITDHMGRTVTLDKPAQTVVSLTPTNTEILFALGMGDKLVGRDASSDYPAEVADIPVVGDYTGPNVEAVIALEPELVLVSNYLAAETIEQLESAGITVAGIEATLYEDIPGSFELVATLVGGDAKPLMEALTAAEEAAATEAAADAPTVYYVMSFGEYGNWTGGKLSFINALIRKAGGNPITDTVEGESAWFEYGLEELVAADPYIILMDAYNGDPSVLTTAEGYADLTAVKEGRVYTVDSNLTSRPGPRIGEALATIAEILRNAK